MCQFSPEDRSESEYSRYDGVNEVLTVKTDGHKTTALTMKLTVCLLESSPGTEGTLELINHINLADFPSNNVPC